MAQPGGLEKKYDHAEKKQIRLCCRELMPLTDDRRTRPVAESTRLCFSWYVINRTRRLQRGRTVSPRHTVKEWQFDVAGLRKLAVKTKPTIGDDI